MSNPTTLSPLKAIEEAVYQKFKDTPVKIWHYAVALAFLTLVPTIISLFVRSSDVATIMITAVVAIAWLSSRVMGRNLSRNKAIDSVLIYRYFAAIPWLISLVATGISLLVAPLDSLSQLLYQAVFWISVVVSLVHVLGIVLHHRSLKKTVRNIKKEDLFQ